jgi:hypothetical protein
MFPETSEVPTTATWWNIRRYDMSLTMIKDGGLFVR